MTTHPSPSPERDAQLRILVEQVPAVLWTTDRDLRYTSTEGAGLAALQLTPDELIGKPVTQTGEAGAEAAEAVLLAHRRALAGESVTYHFQWAGVAFEGHVGPLHSATGEIEGCIGVAIENASLYEQARELAVLQERQRLARDLHDSVAQSLYSLTLMAEAARRLVNAGNIARGGGYLARIGESAQQLLREMRLLVYELRPLILERDGLAAALKQRLETVEGRTGIETSLIVEGTGLVPELIEVELFRIAQEALNNSLKHSGASSVSVRLNTAPEEVSLAVSDNGRGFSPGTIGDKGGLGLVSMQERAHRLGGRLDIKSRPGDGTTITVCIPIPASE